MQLIKNPLAFAVLALFTIGTVAHAAATDSSAPTRQIQELLARPLIDKNLPWNEAQKFCDARVPRMPEVKSAAEWDRLANQMRRDVLDHVVFRDATSKQWRDAKPQFVWLETLPGGPGYRIHKLRYEALPGLWIPALLYEPDNLNGKVPVYLAVNGHDANGKGSAYKQIRCINLAKRGVLALNVEWLGMGQLRSPGSIFISSLDTRVKLCNPVAGYSSFRTRAFFPSDLGDSEQTPNDLGKFADYAQLTAMMAGRAALLTFNAKDNCCFAADHALEPLMRAAGPMFDLRGEAGRLRAHINYDPGTHNYERDNREAFYRFVGDIFFPGGKWDAKEIPCELEVQTNAAVVNVELPAGNLDLNQLARAAMRDLPRDPKFAERSPSAARAKLRDLVHFHDYGVAAKRLGLDHIADRVTWFWQLRLGKAWTVPVIEFTRGTPKGTTIVLADAGRTNLTADVERLLAAGQRVLAVDVLMFGESRIVQRDYLYALLIAGVGERPLGVQSSQLAAIARWATKEFKGGPVSLVASGPRTSFIALVTAALEAQARGGLETRDAMASLKELIENNVGVDARPEQFCFGLLESFDVPQLQTLAGAVPAKHAKDAKGK
ncbi:MAG: hypothetical protein HY301_10260 [Verrucomicrobia bacterium]|nr:hypothetical protein [Verrucomicrobiota bacterium]